MSPTRQVGPNSTHPASLSLSQVGARLFHPTLSSSLAPTLPPIRASSTISMMATPPTLSPDPPSGHALLSVNPPQFPLSRLRCQAPHLRYQAPLRPLQLQKRCCKLSEVYQPVVCNKLCGRTNQVLMSLTPGLPACASGARRSKTTTSANMSLLKFQ